MVESFKITARELGRNLKIHVSLPDDYMNNENEYPIIILFDGQLMYNFIGEETKVFDSSKMIEGIRDKAILLCLHSPTHKDWRASELNPYYCGNNEDIDKVLSFIYYEYIINTVLPLLHDRYRFNIKEMYLGGFKDSAPAILYMLYRYNLFRGAALFDPVLKECSDKLWEDISNRFTCKRSIYLFHGGLNSDFESDDIYYHLSTRFESLRCEYLLNDFYGDLDNSYESISTVFSKGLEFILENRNEAPLEDELKEILQIIKENAN